MYLALCKRLSKNKEALLDKEFEFHTHLSKIGKSLKVVI